MFRVNRGPRRAILIAAAALCILSCAAPGFLRANDTPPQSTTGTLLGRVSVASSQGGMTNNLAAIDRETHGTFSRHHFSGCSLR